MRNSCVIGCRFPEGMEEDLIATIAKDVLQGLEYMHDDGSMHRRVSNFIIACTCLFPCSWDPAGLADCQLQEGSLSTVAK